MSFFASINNLCEFPRENLPFYKNNWKIFAGNCCLLPMAQIMDIINHTFPLLPVPVKIKTVAWILSYCLNLIAELDLEPFHSIHYERPYLTTALTTHTVMLCMNLVVEILPLCALDSPCFEVKIPQAIYTSIASAVLVSYANRDQPESRYLEMQDQRTLNNVSTEEFDFDFV